MYYINLEVLINIIIIIFTLYSVSRSFLLNIKYCDYLKLWDIIFITLKDYNIPIHVVDDNQLMVHHTYLLCFCPNQPTPFSMTRNIIWLSNINI